MKYIAFSRRRMSDWCCTSVTPRHTLPESLKCMIQALCNCHGQAVVFILRILRRSAQRLPNSSRSVQIAKIRSQFKFCILRANLALYTNWWLIKWLITSVDDSSFGSIHNLFLCLVSLSRLMHSEISRIAHKIYRGQVTTICKSW